MSGTISSGGDRHDVALDPATAVELLASAWVGRLVFTYQALPEVIPLNFQLESDGIVIRVSPGSRAAKAALNGVVAFQVDSIDRDNRTGWSVLVVGRSHAVEPRPPADPQAIPWVDGDRSLTILIPLERVSGHQLIP